MMTFGYNNMLPTDVSGTSNYVPSMTYDSAGRLRTRALGNGLTQTYEYYPWNQQGGRLHTLVTGALQNLTYQYDSVGNITQIADSAAGETNHMERWNCTLRQRLARYVRKTLSFSKVEYMHHLVTRWFIVEYNLAITFNLAF